MWTVRSAWCATRAAVERQVFPQQPVYFVHRVGVPEGPGQRLGAGVRGVDQTNVEIAPRGDGRVARLGAPHKARVLTHLDFGKPVALPKRLAVAEGVTRDPTVVRDGVFVQPGPILARVLVQLAHRAAQVGTRRLQNLHLV
jgi:hypothetical protein